MNQLIDERCFVVGESPREKLIHEKPNNIIKTACDYVLYTIYLA